MGELWREGPENAASEVTRAILVLPKSWTFSSSLDSMINPRLFPVNLSFCFIKLCLGFVPFNQRILMDLTNFVGWPSFG